MIIRQTEKQTIDGKPIVEVKIGDKWHTFYQDETAQALIEYDTAIESISFSYESGENNTRKIDREETRKHLTMISNDRVLGFHQYFKPDTGITYKAIVVWSKRGDKWLPSMKKGVSELTAEDMIKLNDGIQIMNKWE